jgi:hypothetical protein
VLVAVVGGALQQTAGAVVTQREDVLRATKYSISLAW